MRVLVFIITQNSIRIEGMKIHRFFILAAFSLILISCADAVNSKVVDLPAQQVMFSEQTLPVSESIELTEGEAVIIDDVRLNYKDTESGSAEIEIDGFLPDGCTELSEVIRSRDENMFTIHLMTTRPEDAQCTMALEPFQISVPLDVSRFEKGEIIQVKVYEFQLEFTIARKEEPEQGGG